jgi:hypothetical protein
MANIENPIENPIENLFVLIALTFVVAKLLLCVVYRLIPNEHMIGELLVIVIVIVSVMLLYIEGPIMRMKFERLIHQHCIHYGSFNYTKCKELNMYELYYPVHHLIV